MNSSEKIKANGTVIIKFIICRNISGYEHDTAQANVKAPHPRKHAKRFSQKHREWGRRHHLLNSSCSTIVSTAPDSLVSQSTSYSPCLLSCLQQESQCANFPILLLTMWLSILSLTSFLLMYQISCLSCLRDQIIFPFLLSYSTSKRD